MWNRREWARVSAMAWLGGTWTSARSQVDRSSRSTQALLMGVDHKASFCYLPLTIAERLGYFQAEGLSLQIREFASPSLAAQALVGGAVQVLSGTYSTNIVLDRLGHSLQSLVLQGLAPQIVMGIARSEGSRFRNLRELRGQRIGVAQLGSSTHRIARLVLAKGRLGEGDVTFRELPAPADALEAFRSGEISVLCYSDPIITQLEQAGEIKILVDTRTQRGSAELFGGTFPAGCLSAKQDWIAGHPDESQALANAMVKALKWLQTAGPSDLINVVPEAYFGGDRALYLAAFSRSREAWSPDGVMPDESPGVAAKMLARLNTTPPMSDQDLSNTFTNRFALKAKARLRA
ncbi:ABC transporter substrate-binding protein [Hydrogenophaga sp. PAMC20947]|uniref:ABC transporter substrate-binding protein n=1 Tax=Hydrogenophaga sp. PAMC20947 TaxID=2565558 RepID=UPI00109D8533|nr:ABC transporter substrate-binding protein [Hydrogenophaga sp. PAMC20947]QCB45638.1 ABC transporter substrate-binding protein [Hydrogenophaga sp. PAMC20947]